MKKMKYKMFFQTIGWAIVFVLLAAMVITPVLADEETRPSIDLRPREGPVGAKVYITLSNFEPGTIDVSFDAEANVIETDSTDDDGNLYTYFIVEEYPTGKYKVWATDSDDNQEIVYFTVVPDIELDESTGHVGDEIIIDGTGFTANSEISIRFDGEEVTIDKTNENGSFNGANFQVPESCNGSHTIKAVDEEGNYTDAAFSTKQSITISNKSGGVGTGVTISGTGFNASSDITIELANDEVAIGKTDENGSFSDSFNVAAMVKGTYKIKVSDGSNNEYADFSIMAGATINPGAGNVGTEVTVSGAGFAPNITIVVKYDKTQVVKVNSDANGTFETKFNAPVSKNGEHTVTITDASNVTEMIFTMESTPPPAPKLLLPASGTKVSETPVFSWEPVSDPSGVTYALEVASDANFSSVVLTKSGLTDLEYIITEGEKLQPVKKDNPYHWRVRAVDRASNKGKWSSVGSFYMGISLAVPPGWVQWGLTGLGVTLFGFLFGTFLNRLKGLVIGN